jgi:integrase
MALTADTPRRAPPNKVKLSDPYIKTLQPQTQPYLVWDTKQRLAVRVQPSGHLSFKYIYSRHGRPRWYSIGPVTIGIIKARKEATKLQVQVDDGKDPAADKKAKRSAGTFEELATSYVEQYAKRENKSWEQADALVKTNLIPKWGKLKAADITRSDVKAMMNRIKAPIVANQTLSAASAVFSWAIREDEAGIKINPCVKIDRNETKTAKSDRILSDSEIPKFWAAFDDVGLIEGAALKTILLTGQRPGEVACMRTEHIVDGCWWNMPGAPVAKLNWPGTKNAQSHSVFLPKEVQQIIKDMGNTGMVFATPRGNAVNGLDRDMREICKALNMARTTPHDLRRTHSSAVAKLFGRDAMNRITNHKEGGIGDIYDAAVYADENQKIMEAVANKFMTLIDGGADNIVHPSFGKAAI